jgi:hypothetical protein
MYGFTSLGLSWGLFWQRSSIPGYSSLLTDEDKIFKPVITPSTKYDNGYKDEPDSILGCNPLNPRIRC